MNSRTRAAQVLVAVIQDGQSLNQALPRYTHDIDSKERALVQELCFGACRWHQRLQQLAATMVKRPLKKKDADIHALILLGIYQLLYTRIPAHAAIHETVQSSKELNKPWATGMLNGVLRRFDREQTTILAKIEKSDPFNYSHPDWMLEQLQSAYPERWQEICDANNARAPLTLRINPHQLDREAYLQQLAEQGIPASATRYSHTGVALDQPQNVNELPGFATGAVSVQDEAAQFAASLLDPKQGERVLDACAAPGGKTCHLLERQPGIQELVALDIAEDRTRLIQENLQRTGYSATVITGNAVDPSEWWDKTPFDRILVDAPCSATGVIRRHPDIKLLRRQQDIAKLADQQSALLQALWPTLKPGGKLLYATCSVYPQENEAIVGRFLDSSNDARELKLDVAWGETRQHGRQLLPRQQGNDGFYYALLEKATHA